MTLSTQLLNRLKEIHLEPPEDDQAQRMVVAKLEQGYVLAVAWKAQKTSMAGVFSPDLPWCRRRSHSNNWRILAMKRGDHKGADAIATERR